VRWPYVEIASSILICLGGGLLTVFLASRRERFDRYTGTKHVQGLGEIASQAAFSGGLLLMVVSDLGVLARVPMSSASRTVLVVSAAILVLLFGVQLGRLLMRYQLRRLHALLDTVTGEVVSEASKRDVDEMDCRRSTE
jgi:hypothetical protein